MRTICAKRSFMSAPVVLFQVFGTAVVNPQTPRPPHYTKQRPQALENRPSDCQRDLADSKRSGGPSSAGRNLAWHLMGDANWRGCFGMPLPGPKVHLSTAETPGRRAPIPPASHPINRATLRLFVSHFHVNIAGKSVFSQQICCAV